MMKLVMFSKTFFFINLILHGLMRVSNKRKDNIGGARRIILEIKSVKLSECGGLYL